MAAFIVAIDNGSQSTKVSVVDAEGRVHASARASLRPYESPRPGQVVHPGDDVWESIVRATRAALDRFTGDRADIVAVGLCTIRFCRAMLDAEGALVEPMLSWMDERVSRPFLRTDERVRWVTTSSGYVTHRLTGQFRDTAANYQGVWPIDQRTWRWSVEEQPFASTGMPRSLLFELVDPGDLLGAVTVAAAATTGLPEGVPVYATANDKAVEALGAGLVSESELLLSLGTYISSMTVGAEPTASDGRYWVNFGSRPGRYLYESDGIRRGMWTVSWFRSLLQHEDGSAGAGGRAAGGDDAMYDLEVRLNDEAAHVAPGSGGLMTVLDWLAPGDAPHRRGAFVGFDGTQDRAAVYRSILEGIAFTMADNAAAMESALGRRFERIILTGGGGRSALMRQIVADVFELPVVSAGVDDAAGMGAAVCAAVGSGVHPGWDAAIAAMVHHSAVVPPVAERSREYERFHRVHTGVRVRTDELFAWMAAELAPVTESPGFTPSV